MADQRHASPGKQQASKGQAGEAGEVKQPRAVEYGGYKLTSDLFASLVSLLVGLAWPALVLLLACLLYQNRVAIREYVDKFMRDKTSVEFSVANLAGLKFTRAAASVTNGLITQQTEANLGPVNPEQRVALEQVANDAARRLVPEALQHPGTLLKVLWVDDQPRNNIGLQYAFQALGMVVISIDSDDGIASAFRTANGFDVVITDMGRGPNRQAGEKTIEIIRNQYPGTPVIVYSSSVYSQTHKELVPPIIAITDSPQRVFTEVTGIATRAASKR